MSDKKQRISGHALDVIFKLQGQALARLLPDRFGLPIAPIARYFPTELPQVDVHLERLDNAFELEDDSLLDLEFQATLRPETLVRFITYGMALLREVEYKRSVRTVVFFGPAVPAAPRPMDFGDVPFSITFILMGDQDGGAALARLRALVAEGGAWQEADRLDLALLPLMRHSQSTEAVVTEALDLAQTLTDDEYRRAAGSLLALAYHYLGDEVLDRLIEELRAMNLLEKVLEESREEGREEGREEAIRQSVLDVLRSRFGEAPSDLNARLTGISGTEQLRALLHAAAVIENVEAFIRLLDTPPTEQ